MKKHLFFITIILSLLLTVSVAGAAGFTSDPNAVEKACKSVLMLEVMKDGEVIATGSGFVAFDNKTLVTNYHVIEDSDMIIALSDDGYEYIIMSVCIADEKKDLAILRFFSPTDLQPLPLRTAVDQKRIESVVAIGSPRGLINTVSTGNISAVFLEDGTQWIQLTAPISNGSSGGALFNDNGEVIGVTTLTRKDSQNINFAIHAKEIEALYKKWNGSTTYLDEYTSSTPTPRPTPRKTPTPTPTPKPTKKSTPTPKQNSGSQSDPTIKKASAYPLSPTSIRITWSTINAAHCSLYYKKSNETTWRYVDTYTSKKATIYGLDPDVSYDFALYAINVKGKSSSPFTLSQRTSSPTPTPNPPAIQQASIIPSSTSAKITWSMSNAIICSIYYKKSSETVWRYVDSYTANNATIYGLEPNVTYDFSLYAINANGQSSSPFMLSRKTTAASSAPRNTATPRPTSKPPVVHSVSFTNVTSTKMTVCWTASSDSTSYKIYYKKNYSDDWTELKETTSKSKQFINLSPNTTYYFKIIAINKNGVQSAPHTTFKRTAAASSIPSSLLKVTYKYGMTDPAIQTIKKKMQSYGYYTKGADVSSKYNDIMVERIKHFQKNNGLKVTGQIDYAFLSKLYSGNVIKTNNYD